MCRPPVPLLPIRLGDCVIRPRDLTASVPQGAGATPRVLNGVTVNGVTVDGGEHEKRKEQKK